MKEMRVDQIIALRKKLIHLKFLLEKVRDDDLLHFELINFADLFWKKASRIKDFLAFANEPLLKKRNFVLKQKLSKNG